MTPETTAAAAPATPARSAAGPIALAVAVAALVVRHPTRAKEPRAPGATSGSFAWHADRGYRLNAVFASLSRSTPRRLASGPFRMRAMLACVRDTACLPARASIPAR
jgi:hypothetical protein